MRDKLKPNKKCHCGCGYVEPAVIQSEIERQLFDATGRTPSTREHRFTGGPPPKRLYFMGVRHEARARRKGLRWHLIDLRQVYQHYRGHCGICQKSVGLDEFHIDHIYPIYLGGGHVWENLQPTHKRCNEMKGGRG